MPVGQIKDVTAPEPDWTEARAATATNAAIAVAPKPSLPAVKTDADRLLGSITLAAKDSAVDVDKLERLMGLYDRVREESARRAYDLAMAEMQTALPVIRERGQVKNNTTIQSTYALWEDIAADIKPILARHGFAITFRVEQSPGLIKTTAIVSHAEGHREQTTVELQPDSSGQKNAVQMIGSSISYGKRYAAILLLNLVTTNDPADDGGKGAGEFGLPGRDAPPAVGAAITAINLCNGKAELRRWKAANAEMLASLPGPQADQIVRVFNTRWTKSTEEG